MGACNVGYLAFKHPLI